MEDRERLDGGQQAGLVHQARTRARREVQGKEWKTAQNWKRNGKPIGIVIVINSHHLGAFI